MATSTRLRGNLLPVFTLKKGAAAAVSFADDLKTWELEPAEKDSGDLTFAEAAAGAGVDWAFNGTAIVSFDAGSLFGYLFDNAGSDVEVKFGPKGNATASATSPHFTGTATISLPPGFSNEARTTAEGAEFEFTLNFSTALTKVVA
jgi:hypothetical protein